MAKAKRRAKQSDRKIGYAVIGLGHIVQHAVLPAFKNADGNSKLVALVSGDREKREELGQEYGVPAFDYEQLDEVLALPDVEAVYIGLPNDMHAEYVVRCAKAGAHVLCEKPLAISSAECERMISACDEAGVRLMTAYRLHLERSNLKVIDLVESGKLGDPHYFSSIFSYQVEEGNIRTMAARGGGPQWDIGIYCVNAARYLLREEPTEVFAFTTSCGDARFKETPEQFSVSMKFPNGKLAQFACSFGTAAAGSYDIVGTKGMARLENAYEYEGDRILRTIIEDEEKKKKFGPTDQFGPEVEYFSDCLIHGEEPEMDGWEGLADVRIIEAINRSVEEGRPVRLEPFEKPQRPEPEMVKVKPQVVTEDLVNAQAPHRE